MPGAVHKTAQVSFCTAEIQDGREPWFGLELWFLTFFRGKPVWALNREHLIYLIDYLSADLREKPSPVERRNSRRSRFWLNLHQLPLSTAVFIKEGRWSA